MLIFMKELKYVILMLTGASYFPKQGIECTNSVSLEIV